jgi:hypothetical protein
MIRYEARLLLFIVITSLLHSPAQAGVCQPPTVQIEIPYSYIVSLANALSWAKSGIDRTSPTALGAEPTDFDLFLGLKLGKTDFECAKSQVLPFLASSNKAIKISAKGVTLVFSLLVDLQDKSVALYKAALDDIAEGKLKPGSILERQAELAASYDEAWKLLVPAVIASTYAVVEVDPATGLTSRLALTQIQKDEILNKLHTTFGNDIKDGIREGQFPLTAAAAALYQVLGDTHRKLRSAQ